MWFWGSLWKIWQMKQAYDKYKSLKKSLDNLVIRAKEWKYIDEDWNEVQWAVVVDLDWEMKLRNFMINDTTLLDPKKKSELENLVIATFQKAQAKAQEVAAEKTKDVLWVDPNNLWALWDMLWGLGG